VLIRSARPEDIEEVLALWSDADAEPTHTDKPASLGLLLRHNQESVLVAELNGRVLGTVIAGWDGWRGSIYRLVVHPRHRRQGLGRQLLTEAESRLSKLGAHRVQASTPDAVRRSLASRCPRCSAPAFEATCSASAIDS
jgi:ribosomal protein S18 acetylase RimI-like enzyme